ncbi:MAG: hypothetical protein U1E30_13665 [Rhodoblastus sp.]
MTAAAQKPRLNALSKAILAATAAVGLAAVVSAAPTNVAAYGRATIKAPEAARTLNAAPGLVLTRAVRGSRDEGCYAVSTADGAARSAMFCAH